MLLSRNPGNLHTLRQAGLAALLACMLLLIFSGSTLAAGSKGRVEPIFARYARIYHAPTLDLKVEYFRDKPMEELDDFNGYTATLDFTYPINDMSQIQLLLPLYTNGRAIITSRVSHLTVARLMSKAMAESVTLHP
jgi:hypothetical protein